MIKMSRVPPVQIPRGDLVGGASVSDAGDGVLAIANFPSITETVLIPE
jgi:hypothetical protein